MAPARLGERRPTFFSSPVYSSGKTGKAWVKPPWNPEFVWPKIVLTTNRGVAEFRNICNWVVNHDEQ